jgi:hypothetical protein
VTAALLLLLVSAILGLATGLLFRVWAFLLLSPLLAIAAAIVLHSSGLGFVAGVSLIVGCLVASQFAYLVTTFLLHGGEASIEDEVDGEPGCRGEQDVCEKHE